MKIVSGNFRGNKVFRAPHVTWKYILSEVDPRRPPYPFEVDRPLGLGQPLHTMRAAPTMTQNNFCNQPARTIRRPEVGVESRVHHPPATTRLHTRGAIRSWSSLAASRDPGMITPDETGGPRWVCYARKFPEMFLEISHCCAGKYFWK